MNYLAIREEMHTRKQHQSDIIGEGMKKCIFFNQKCIFFNQKQPTFYHKAETKNLPPHKIKILFFYFSSR